jgi:hypothetical protein
VLEVGRIDIDKFKGISDCITTDKVVITERQIDHIKERHPQDYERFSGYMPQILKNPDYIIEDEHSNTAVLLKEIASSGERFHLILRLHTSQDPVGRKNSVITFLRIGKVRFDQYIRNKKVLYKAE